MLFDKEQTLLIADYIRDAYEDDSAHRKLEAYLKGFDAGWKEAIGHATQYVRDWHENMDSMHESTLKGILTEVEHGIHGLQFGDV